MCAGEGAGPRPRRATSGSAPRTGPGRSGPRAPYSSPGRAAHGPCPPIRIEAGVHALELGNPAAGPRPIRAEPGAHDSSPGRVTAGLTRTGTSARAADLAKAAAGVGLARVSGVLCSLDYSSARPCRLVTHLATSCSLPRRSGIRPVFVLPLWSAPRPQMPLGFLPAPRGRDGQIRKRAPRPKVWNRPELDRSSPPGCTFRKFLRTRRWSW